MEYCQHQFNFQENPETLEITDFQISSLRSLTKNKYPHPISHRVSRNHRSYGAIFQSNRYVPKTCSISKSNSTENAVDILKYQLHDETAKKVHLENIRLNLERRLESAKAQGNNYLVNLLQKESRELEFS